VNKLQASIVAYTQEWKLHLKKDPKQAVNRIQSWQPPPVDWIMLNADAAFSSVTGRGGWGALARDNDGDLIVAEAGSVPAAIDALHVETFAVLKAITMLHV
jgi:hypothetical protein